MSNYSGDAQAPLLLKLESYLNAITEPFDTLRLCVIEDHERIEFIRRAYTASDNLPDLLEEKTVRSYLRKNADVFVQRWPKIKYWIIHFVNSLSSRDDVLRQVIPRLGAFTSPEAVCCRILNSLLVSTDIPVLQDMVVKDSEIVDFLYSVHQSQGKRYGENITLGECRAWKDHFTMYPLMALGAVMNRMSNAHPTKEIAWDKQKFKDVAITVRRTMQYATRVSTLYSEETFLHSEVTLSTSTKLMNDLLFMKGSVASGMLWSTLPVSAEVLRYIIDTALGRQNMQMEHLNLLEDISSSAAVPFVKFFAQERPTPEQLRKLVRRGLLEICAGMCVLESKFPQTGWIPLSSRALLAKVHAAFTSYMCYYDIASITSNSLLRLDPAQLDAAVAKPAMGKSWSTSVEYVIRKHLFASRRELCSRRCDNCQLVIDGVDALNVCGGCRFQRYCSANCQRNAWRDGGHQTSCEDLKTQSKYNKQLEFFAYIASSDVQFSLPGIQATAQRLHTGTDLSKLIITVDYTPQLCLLDPTSTLGRAYKYKHAPTLSITKLSRADTQCKDYHSACQKRGLQLVQAHFQLGDKQITVFLGVGLKPRSRKHKSMREVAVQGSKRLRCGIRRSLRYAPRDKETPTLEAVEWDEVDEIWSRAIAHEIAFIEAIEIEAQRYAVETSLTDREPMVIIGCEARNCKS